MKNAKVTRFSGQLFAVTLTGTGREADQTYKTLKEKCGGGEPDTVLTKNEIARLPAGRTLVFTGDSYRNLIPVFCPLE